MSGIVGILSFDDEPVDRRLLRQMTAKLQFRGPDGQDTWSDGRAGLGHAALRSTIGSRPERQPCSLDGRVWIVADARVDGRSELRGKLRSAGHACREDATDSELILFAYRAWREECVRHLLGDFAFAIWDSFRQQLFCARDHFGVKPFFYAHAGGCLIIGNTLSCLREHPGISHELNDRAIADFLLSDYNHDPSTTAFEAIQRLPPAHRLTCHQGAVRVERFWELPGDCEVRYQHPRDYVEHFREHLNTAVSDRLRNDRVGVLMSGGIDSTSVAASAKAVLANQHQSCELRAYTGVCDTLIADDERHFSALAAKALEIPIHYLVADDYALFEGWGGSELLLPEPANEPLSVLYLDQARQVALHGRVVLTGWDGDALLNERAASSHGVAHKSLNFARRAARLLRRSLSRRRRPRRGLRAAAPEEAFVLPPWLDPELCERVGLEARWREIRDKTSCGSPHRRARELLGSAELISLLESYDPGVVRVPVEARHPLLDVRLVEYVLALPVSPWCVKKHLLRVAMQGRLPESIRIRPKALLAGNPVRAMLQRRDARWVDAFQAAPALARYVDRQAIPALAGAQDSEEIWTNLRPLCLNFWLQQLNGAGRSLRREDYHEAM